MGFVFFFFFLFLPFTDNMTFGTDLKVCFWLEKNIKMSCSSQAQTGPSTFDIKICGRWYQLADAIPQFHQRKK